MPRYTITIQDRRAPELEQALGTATLPILSPAIEQVVLGELGPVWCVRVDVGALSKDQRERLLVYLTGLWGVAREEIERSMAKHGLPLMLGDSEVNILPDDGDKQQRANS